MNKKALSLAITLAMAFPTVSHALGLGDIQSNSHLNQPFRGQIPVLSASPSEVKSIRVRIASPEVFNRVGIDRPAFLNSIRFRPTIQNGRPVILVSSSQPIHEPFVNFLLEVNWSKGQLLKEYTALLDPPVLMQPGTAIASNRAGVRAEPGYDVGYNRPAAQRQQQARRQPQRRIVRAPARRPQVRHAAPNRRVAAAPARSTTYRVRGGDTLFKVAKKLGYRGIRTEQMMMALYEANPKAFHRNNVNILKKGSLLKRPPIQHPKSITYRAAKRQLASQTAAWKKYRSGLSGHKTQVASNGNKSAGQSARSLARDNANNKSDYQFKVSGSKGGAVNDIKVSGNASVAELKKQLTMASESLASRSSENSELKSRVSELESLLRKKNRLITIKSEQLSELQARLGGKAPEAKPEETTVVSGSTETNDAANEGNDIAGVIDDQNQEGQVVRAAPEPVEQPEVVEQPDVEPQPVVANTDGEDDGILGLLADPTLIAGGLGAGGLLLGGLWFMKRRKENDDDEFADEEFEDFDLDLDQNANQEAGFSAESELDTDFGTDLNTKTDAVTSADFGENKMFEEPKPKAEASSSASLDGDSKEDNILQEADVYLVYGLHDQAESELRRAIEAEPDNLAYRAKLIENFKAAGDKEAFEKEAKIFSELEGADKDKHWADISGWGKSLIPESSLFSGRPNTEVAESDDSKGGVAGLAAGAAAAAAGLAVTAGNASPDDSLVDESATQFSDDLDNVFDNDGLEDLNLDAVLSDESDSIDDIASDLIADVDAPADLDMSSFEVDTDMDFTSDLTGDLDGLDNKVSEMTGAATDKVESFDLDVDDLMAKADDKLDVTNLNLDIDGQDFDKIMPEDHAYKKADDTEALVSNDEENLLADFDDNLSFLDLEDKGEVIEETQISTKLDLAKAYMDMGDIDGARSTLEEVMLEGNDEQKRQAEELLHQTG